MKVNDCASKNVLECSCIKIDKKSHYTVITAIALVALGLVALGLTGHFLPQSSVALQLGVLGSYGSVALGGVILAGIAAILVRNAIRRCEKNENDTTQGEEHSARSSLAGSVVIRDDAPRCEMPFLGDESSSLVSVVIRDDASEVKMPFVREESSPKSSVNQSQTSNQHGRRRLRTTRQPLKEGGSTRKGTSLPERRIEKTISRNKLTPYAKKPRSLRGSIFSEWMEEAAATSVDSNDQLAVVGQYLERFKKNAKNLIEARKAPLIERSFNHQLTPEQEAMLDTTYREIRRAKARGREAEGVQVYPSGENCVFEITNFPGYIFKINEQNHTDQVHVKEYIKLREDARQICKERNLYMIQVPECFFVEVNGRYYIAEEKIEELYGDYDFQKSLYRWIENQEDLETYFEELLSQLADFVVQFKFADVKANNIPLDVNTGQLFLIDLDQDSALQGLTKGFAPNKKDGVLSYTPLKWFDSIYESAGRDLPEEVQEKYARRGDNIRRRLVKRRERNEDYNAFLGNTKMTDPIVYHPNPKNEAAICGLASTFVNLINPLLATRARCERIKGRQVEIDFSRNSDLYGAQNDFDRYFLFRGNIENALKELKAQNAIFGYKIKNEDGKVVVYC